MLESLLDEIPQLGESRRKALLDRFGSVTAIRKASLDELTTTPGIGTTIGAIIYSHLSSLTGTTSAGISVDMQTGEISQS